MEGIHEEIYLVRRDTSLIVCYRGFFLSAVPSTIARIFHCLRELNLNELIRINSYSSYICHDYMCPFRIFDIKMGGREGGRARAQVS